MPSLDDVARSYTDLSSEHLEWLHLLVSDWQIVADLSFADLVLWLLDREGHGYWGGAQMRPTTGPTAYVDDVVGAFVPRGRRPLLDVAFDERRIAREGDPEWRDDVPVRMETIPIVRDGALLGVIARTTNLLGVRTPSRLELAYLQTAGDLTRMISRGRFPYAGQRREWTASPRVGDGFLRVDSSGVVEYASPNAQSAYRRLGLAGDLVGQPLSATTELLVQPSSEPVAESLGVTLSGAHHRETEFGNESATVLARVVPLEPEERHEGALVLLRDVTEVRSRERELITKDATIREIHHRVKNNLQTVAALLRLQARRLPEPEARAALEEAVRRVGSIAVVHETLSRTLDEHVDFDEVADRLRAMVTEVASGSTKIVTVRSGSFGRLAAETATPLAMALTEVLQNAVEHGFRDRGGTIALRVLRLAGRLQVSVDDDGCGLPDDFDPDSSGSLGLSIVRTLVESELGGILTLGPNPGGGTSVDVDVPLTAVPG